MINKEWLVLMAKSIMEKNYNVQKLLILYNYCVEILFFIIDTIKLKII